MAATVITIARTAGAGAEDVARGVAGQLGFRYVDDEIIQEAAKRAGVSADIVEKTEHKKPLLERLVATLASGGIPEAGIAADASMAVFAASAPYQEFIVDVIRETAAQGNAVIVAHGAGMCLADNPAAFRVFITASPEIRAARLAATGLSADKAANEVRKSDGDRADFFRRFYRVTQESETHYDLVCNTDRMGADAVAKLIVAAARG
jgi:cytidylate kinase